VVQHRLPKRAALSGGSFRIIPSSLPTFFASAVGSRDLLSCIEVACLFVAQKKKSSG
jgi:hypothetical protein